MASSDLAVPPGAVWIGSEHAFDLHEAYLDFRRVFTLDQAPAAATLFITADSRYRLWVNGQFSARGPARCWPHAQSVDALDLAPYLQAGRNLLAVQVYQPGYSHFAYVHRGLAGLLAWLEADGAVALVTGAHWRVRRNPSFNALVRRVSIYGSGVEDRDLNLDDAWPAPGYDDARWAAARVVAPPNTYPWTDLRRREVPLLVERDHPLALVERRHGPSQDDADPHLALRAGWLGAAPCPAAAPDWFTVTLPAGQAAFWLFDLGCDYQGQGWAEIEGAAGAETLLVSYAERIRAGQLVLSNPDTYCRVRLTDRFRLRAGAQTAASFALRGGRYLLFQISGPGRLRVRFHARVAEYPLTIARPFAAGDPELARIAALCQATLAACLSDTFVDGVWRENSQWLGDALPQALGLAALSDDVRPLRRILVMAAEGAYPDGVLPSVLPGEAHAYIVVDYNFTWVELLALYHRLTNDDALITALWPALVRLLDRFQQDVGAAGLIVSQPGRRLFLDWAPVTRNEPHAIYNLRYLLAVQTAARLAADLGRTADAGRWASQAADLRAACRAAFWDGRAWKDDAAGATFSQLAAALAVLAGAAEPGEVPDLLASVAARSLDDSDEPLPGRLVLASPFMHHYVFEALRAGGRAEAVVAIIRRRWGRWVAAGYPTAWENWSVDFPDGSQCHAFSAHPLYHLAEIARGSPAPG